MKARWQELSVAEQAAQWVVALDDPADPVRLDEFTAWLKASPQNVEAYLAATASWAQFDDSWIWKNLRDGNLPETISDNVIELTADETSPIRPHSARKEMQGRWRAAWFGAATTVTIAALAAWALSGSPGQTFSTETGEQRTVQLPDGSVVHLNTRSKLRIRYSNGQRQARLLTGEALFDVVRDPARPFIIDSGGAAIEVLGTQFNVYRRRHETSVTVLEGAVRISAAVLNAGEAAAILPDGAVEPRHLTDITDAVAWRERRLVFRDAPLAEIVAEFNRYNATYRLQLKTAPDPDVRLNGVFRADDPEALLLFLSNNTDLRIERTGGGAIIR